MKPSIKKGIIITSVCAFTLVGIKFYLSSSNTVEVHSVSSLNTGYWDNPSTSTGLVSNSDTQSVLYDSSKTITQVFVKEGQQVSVGDPLLSYDLTTLQSAALLCASNIGIIAPFFTNNGIFQIGASKLFNVVPPRYCFPVK